MGIEISGGIEISLYGFGSVDGLYFSLGVLQVMRDCQVGGDHTVYSSLLELSGYLG